jgi:molybdenum cofactor guanylyltransferase
MTAAAPPGGRAAKVAAAIIAGGRGQRLGGVDKSALVIGGQTILEHQIAVLTPLFSRVLLVRAAMAPGSSIASPSSVTVVHDRFAGKGPLAGIDAALAVLIPAEDAVVCVGSDMPFLRPALLAQIRDAATDAPAVVPRRAGHAEPLLARYGRAFMAPIAQALATGALSVRALLAQQSVHWLEEAALRSADPELRSFENVNTPEDLQRLAALAKS